MPDDRIVAHHEAGHVIAAHALGQSISTVELTDTGGEFRPFERATWEPTTAEGKQAFRDAVLRSIGPENLEEMFLTMVSLLAGLAAQRRLIGHAHDDYADADLDQCEGIARAVTRSPVAACDPVAHTQERADRIVAHHWAAIETLAAELLLHRRLDVKQIMDIIVLGPAARRRRAWDQIVAQTKAAFGGATLAVRSW
jgi:hypothetical protein